MKRSLFLVIALLLSLSFYSKEVSYNDALKTASSFFSASSSPTASKISAKRSRSAQGDLSLSMTGTQSDGKPAFYIINNGTKGFVIVSADDNTKQILGYSNSAAFVPEDIPPHVQFWLERYAHEIEMASDEKPLTSTGPSAKYEPIDSLLGKIKHNQTEPYNNQCPLIGNERTVTGCVATAAGQIMTYHKYPAKGKGQVSYTWNNTTLSLDLDESTYKWDNVLPKYVKNNNTSNYNSAQDTAISFLLRDIGYSCNMNYGLARSNGSSASDMVMGRAFVNNFSYDKSLRRVMYNASYTPDENGPTTSCIWNTEADVLDEIYSNLKAGLPVMISGQSPNNGGGHAFVCDGMDADGLLHINWGWAGMADGYYQLTSLKPKKGGTGAGMGQYTESISILMNIKKAEASTEPYLTMGVRNQYFVARSNEFSKAKTTRDSFFKVKTTNKTDVVYAGRDIFNLGCFDATDMRFGYKVSKNNVTIKDIKAPFYIGSNFNVEERWSDDMSLKSSYLGGWGYDIVPKTSPSNFASDIPNGVYDLEMAIKEEASTNYYALYVWDRGRVRNKLAVGKDKMYIYPVSAANYSRDNSPTGLTVTAKDDSYTLSWSGTSSKYLLLTWKENDDLTVEPLTTTKKEGVAEGTNWAVFACEDNNNLIYAISDVAYGDLVSNTGGESGEDGKVEGVERVSYSSVVFSLKTRYDSLVGGRGVFSVNNRGTKVTFATGNLQYQASTKEWRFASEQWETIGADNAQISSSNENWIDLFGWGTSGYHDASDNCNVNYQPYATSSAAQSSTCGTNNKYGYGPTSTSVMDLTGDFASYDWGFHNKTSTDYTRYDIASEKPYAVSNESKGCVRYPAGIWRVLSRDEWAYIFNTRKVEYGEKLGWCIATIQDKSVVGLLLFPDGFSLRKYTNTGLNASCYGSKITITLNAWKYLEALGCVFLPCTGVRSGTSVSSTTNGYYWSATAGNDGVSESAAYSIYFQGSGTNTSALNAASERERYEGCAVRLVHTLKGNKIADYDVALKPENECSNNCKDVRTETKDTSVTLCGDENGFDWQIDNTTRPYALEDGETEREFSDTLRSVEGCDSIIYNVTLRKITWKVRRDSYEVTMEVGSSCDWNLGYKTLPCTLTTEEGADFYDTLRSKISGCDSVISHLKVHAKNSGGFSVGEGQKVDFAPGNLQFQASTGTWRFAEHQYDIIGDGNKNIADDNNYAGWIDLFGWGTSGKGTDPSRSYPWKTPSVNMYGPESGSFDAAASEENRSYDWGYANEIYEGSIKHPAKTWRTPTSAEWDYLINTRSINGNKPYSYVNLQYSSSSSIDGVIIYPDGFTFAGAGVEKAIEMGNKKSNLGSVDATTWAKLEAAGCVFIPRTPYRDGRNMRSNYGIYWTSTNTSEIWDAKCVNWFGQDNPVISSNRKYYGYAVRLVADREQSTDACDNVICKHNDTTVVLTKGATSFTWNMGYKTRTFPLEDGKVKDEFYDTLRSSGGCDSIISHLTLSLPTFAVSEKEDIQISFGNLQYQGSTKTWRFAPTQYERCGVNNNNPSANSTNWIDLFGWGTSGKEGARPPYYTSTTGSDYSWSDWGQNEISGYPAGTWRTPTSEDWTYMLTVRTVNGGAPYSFVRIKYGDNDNDTVTGVLIYPNDFTWKIAGVDAIAVGAEAGIQAINAITWSRLDNAGCIFLPSAAYRDGAEINADFLGYTSYYWSSTEVNGSINVARFNVSSNSINPAYTLNKRHYGFPVRLIRNIGDLCYGVTAEERDTLVMHCDGNSYTWQLGSKSRPVTFENNETEKTFADTLLNKNGCDSIIYNVTVRKTTWQTTNRDTFVVLCNGGTSYTWDMRDYKSKPVSLEGNATEGIFKDTLRATVGGCDSIYYKLTLRKRTWQTTNRDTFVVLCNGGTSYTWDMRDYKSKPVSLEGNATEGIFKDTLRATVGGCDSIYYKLTLRKRTWELQQKDTVVLLKDVTNFSWNVGYKTLPCTLTGNEAQKDFYDTLRATVGGCDSIVCHIRLMNEDKVGISISDDQKIIFAPGNLQYQGKTKKWRFAEHQYDRCGKGGTESTVYWYDNGVLTKTTNVSPSENYGGWIDLFGWGATGINNANKPYYTSTSASNYSWSEWGDNKINDYPEGMWRTPTKDDWEYMLKTRKVNEDSGFSYVKLLHKDIIGVLIYPDAFTWQNAGVTKLQVGAKAGVQDITEDVWNKLESAGCVFLPNASRRNGTNVDDFFESMAHYWSATISGSSQAYKAEFFFNNNKLEIHGDDRFYGNSVRLVKNLPTPCDKAEERDTLVVLCNGGNSYTWQLGSKSRPVTFGTNETEKTFEDTLLNKNGCDSIIYKVTVRKRTWELKQKDTTVILKDGATSFAWKIGTTTFTHSLAANEAQKDFYDTLRSKVGKCDSIICRLRLMIEDKVAVSVEDKKKVIFSPGNLQYQGSTKTWRFAEHQYDRCGKGGDESTVYWNNNGTLTKSNNAQAGENYGGWIDLFGWGASGVEPGRPPYYTDNTASNYSWSEWGQNVIGGYPKNTWRTLTKDDWTYLLTTRKVDNNKTAYSYVKLHNGITGVLIYPDKFTFANAGVTELNVGADKGVQTITEDVWNKLELAGCVFLPGASRRDGTKVEDFFGSMANYWSSTSSGYKAEFFFNNKELKIHEDSKHYGNSVRLVQNIGGPCDGIQTETRDTTIMPCDGATSFTWTLGSNSREVSIPSGQTQTSFDDTLRTKDGCDSIIYNVTLRKKQWSSKDIDTTVMPCDGSTKYTWNMPGYKEREFELEDNATRQVLHDTLRSKVGNCDSIYYNLTLIKKTWELKQKDTTVILKDGATSFTWKVGNRTIPGSLTANEAQKDFYDTLRSKVGGCDSIIAHMRLMIADKVAISVSDDRQVVFSPGNLQYQGSTKKWRFAEHQYDIIGESNKNIAADYAGWIDLFGWGTSGVNGARPPYFSSKTENEYSWSEWGQNVIGSDPEGMWRTVKIDEWEHLLITRQVNGGAGYSFVTLTGPNVQGIIIYPDAFTFAKAGVSAITVGTSGNSSVNADVWAKLETAGCVFLPITGSRDGTEYTAGKTGYYWSSTAVDQNSTYAYQLKFGTDNPSINYNLSSLYRLGYAVRLVHNIFTPCDAIKTTTRDTTIMPCDGTSMTWTLGSNSREVSIPSGQTQTSFDDTLRTKNGLCDSIYYKVTLRKKTWSTETKDTTVTLYNNVKSYSWKMQGYKTKTVSLTNGVTEDEFKDTLRTKNKLCDSIYYHLTLRSVNWKLKWQDTTVVLKEGLSSYTWNMKGHRNHTFTLAANELQREFYDTLRSKVVKDCDSIIYHLTLCIEREMTAEFSVSGRRKVFFAPGNLQYCAAQKKWRFGVRQFDRVGNGKQAVVPGGRNQTAGYGITNVFWDSLGYTVPCSNLRVSATYGGWVDVFSWGTSGIGDARQPYFAGKRDDFSWSEWGQNAIGAKSANTWRTPSSTELDYLLNTRKVNGAAGWSLVNLKYGNNETDTITGMIIYPDNFTWSAAGVNAIPVGTGNYTAIEAATWKALEKVGCVFLPAALDRSYSYGKFSVNEPWYGLSAYYWTSTAYSRNMSEEAYSLRFSSISRTISFTNGYHSGTYPVRLVRNTAEDPCETWELENKDTTVILTEGKKSFAWNVGYKTLTWSLANNEAQKDFYDTLRAKKGGCDSIICHMRLMQQDKVTFSISNKNKVVFAPGNLQYCAAKDKWRFAERQYDNCSSGGDQTTVYWTDGYSTYKCNNKLVSETYAGWIDLFGWGTSGVEGANPPYFISQTNADYTWSDWGQNMIGGHTPNTWRTLKSGEWDYLLNTRKVNEDTGFSYVALVYDQKTKYAGTLLYPDNFTWENAGVNALPVGVSEKRTEIDVATWIALEKAGCIFLPHTSVRSGSGNTISLGNEWDDRAYYWTASADANGTTTAHIINIVYNNRKVNLVNANRSYGYAVRLVQNIGNQCGDIETETRDTIIMPCDGNTKYTWTLNSKSREVSIPSGQTQTSFDDTLRTKDGKCDIIYYKVTLRKKTWELKRRDTVVILTDGKTSFAWKIGTTTFTHSLAANEAQKDFYDTLRSKVGKCDSIICHLRLMIEDKVAVSVENNRKVIFSPGNLQYQGSSKTWRFAEHQYDYIGDDNAKAAQDYAGWIDLFGWGASGVEPGRPPYYKGTSASDYSWSEWGQNVISGYPKNTWRTLTKDDWTYLLTTRKVNNKTPYSYVKLHNGITGVLIYPDAFTWTAAGVTELNVGADKGVQTITEDVWNKLELAGCVFLPGASRRDGNTVNNFYTQHAHYWSSTANGYKAEFFFQDKKLQIHEDSKHYGNSVRLVQNIVTPCAIQTTTRDTTVMPCDGATSFTWTLGSKSREVSIPSGQTQTSFDDTLRTKDGLCDSIYYKVTLRKKTWEKKEIPSTAEVEVGQAYQWALPHTTKPCTLTKATGDKFYDTVRSKIGGCDSIIYVLTLKEPNYFSVSSSQKVLFSPGNVQYQGSTKTWRFAPNQYDRCMANNNNAANTSYSGWIDLFGWGTGNAPNKTSTSNNDYSTFTDWGTNFSGNWRTLKSEEWQYLINTRKVNNAAGYSYVRINYGSGDADTCTGVLIYPDNFTWEDAGISSISMGSSAGVQSISATQWAALEKVGCVFLPGCSFRNGTSFSASRSGRYADYWSATQYGDRAYRASFDVTFSSVNPASSNRYLGYAVRLVRNL